MRYKPGLCLKSDLNRKNLISRVSTFILNIYKGVASKTCILFGAYLLDILVVVLNILRDVSAVNFKLVCQISSGHQSQFQSHHPLCSENPFHSGVGNKKASMWRGADTVSQVINDHSDMKNLK